MQSQVKNLDFSGQNIYAGIDAHKKSWTVSIYTDRLYHKTFNQPPNGEALHKYLCKNFPNGTYYSVYEAGFCGYWIHHELEHYGINNMIVHPADIPLKDKERKGKTDRVDSNKLARHLRSGELEPIYVHREDHLSDRSLIRMRKTLSKEQTRWKNRIKSSLNFFKIQPPEAYKQDSSYWSNRFITWLEDVTMRTEAGTYSFKNSLENLKRLRKDILEINKKIRALSREDKYRKRVDLLISIPGIGSLTAMIILSEIDDINRFKDLDQLASYVGIIPTSHSSGEKQTHGEMTNRGNKYIKSTLIESAWTAARVDPGLHLDYLTLCKRMKANKAIIRITRKLLRRIRYVLKNEVPLQELTESKDL